MVLFSTEEEIKHRVSNMIETSVEDTIQNKDLQDHYNDDQKREIKNEVIDGFSIALFKYINLLNPRQNYDFDDMILFFAEKKIAGGRNNQFFFALEFFSDQTLEYLNEVLDHFCYSEHQRFRLLVLQEQEHITWLSANFFIFIVEQDRFCLYHLPCKQQTFAPQIVKELLFNKIFPTFKKQDQEILEKQDPEIGKESSKKTSFIKNLIVVIALFFATCSISYI